MQTFFSWTIVNHFPSDISFAFILFISLVETSSSSQTYRWIRSVTSEGYLQNITSSSSSSSSSCLFDKKQTNLRQNNVQQTCTIFRALRNDSTWASGISRCFVTSVVTVRWTVTDEWFINTSYSPWFTGKPASGTQLKV